MCNNWICWTQSEGLERGILTGQMPEQNVEATLLEFRKEALEYLNKTNAECVIYATKEYGEAGKLNQMRFYTRLARTDEELKNLTDLIDGEIYAVHRGDNV